MPLLWVLLVVTLTISFMLNSEQTTQDRNTSFAEVTAASVNMLVYRNAVANYAYLNPAFSGVVPDNLLSLPSWYVKPQSLSNYVLSGKSYSFYSGPLPGLAGELARQTESINVGINQNGVLSSPNMANSGIVLPAQIPLGSVVLIQ
jgi:hypothetical protein